MPRSSKLGRPALFSTRFGIKDRQHPISITLNARHRRMAKRATTRLGISRNDLFSLLLERYAATVTVMEPSTR